MLAFRFGGFSIASHPRFFFFLSFSSLSLPPPFSHSSFPLLPHFSSPVETCGVEHVVNVGGAGIIAAGDLSAVDSISPATAFVDGAVYTVTLRYQDCGGHSVEVTADRTLDYAGTNTLPPSLIEPGSSSSIANDFFIEFSLPESACAGSVYLTFLRSGGLVTDAYTGERKVILGSSVETRGTHRFQMTWFREAVANIAEVSSIIPSASATIGEFVGNGNGGRVVFIVARFVS